MKIAEATAQDVSELNKLINSAYRGEESKKGWTNEAEILGGIRVDEKALHSLLAEPGVRILKYTTDTGVMLGTVYLELKVDELYLGMFAVSPVSQGAGIGKALLLAAEEYALNNGNDRITISVISSRTELIDWYKRHGYLETGESIAFEEIENRFGDPKVPNVKLIVMQKLLKIPFLLSE